MFRVRAQIRPISNEDATWAAAASSEPKSDFEGEEMKKKLAKFFLGKSWRRRFSRRRENFDFSSSTFFFSSQAAKKRKGKLPRVEKKVERLDFGGKIRLLNNSSLATGFGRAKYKSFFRSQTLPIKPVLPKAVQLSFHFKGKTIMLHLLEGSV